MEELGVHWSTTADFLSRGTCSSAWTSALIFMTMQGSGKEPRGHSVRGVVWYELLSDIKWGLQRAPCSVYENGKWHLLLVLTGECQKESVISNLGTKQRRKESLLKIWTHNLVHMLVWSSDSQYVSGTSGHTFDFEWLVVPPGQCSGRNNATPLWRKASLFWVQTTVTHKIPKKISSSQ